MFKIHKDIPDEVTEVNITSSNDVWQLFFDGASRTKPKGKIAIGVWVLFILPENHVLPRVFSLTESYSNNVAEYNALLIDLQLTQQMRVQYLEAYGDSKLIINQVKGEYEVCHQDLIPYYHETIQLATTFEGFYINHVSRLKNTKANYLAALAATLALPADTSYYLTVATRHLFCPKYDLEVSEVHTTSTNVEPRDWRFPIIDYALHDILPNDLREAASV